MDKAYDNGADLIVVGIGASAGGLQSLERFFAEMPRDTGMAFVLIQHLSPDFKTMMDELLARYTAIPIVRAEGGMPLEANRIYLLPPNKEMIVSSGRLHLADKDPASGLTLPIDHFLRSLAHEYGPNAIAVILSGTGSDGARGVIDVHAAGGLVISETSESAKFDGMPLSAQRTGVVDEVLAASEMASVLVDYLQHKKGSDQSAVPANDETGSPDNMSAIFELLRREYDIDFAHYKPNTVNRRIERRLSLLHITELEEYVQLLSKTPGELNALYQDLLIGVTKFFRDSEPYHLLEKEVIPRILDRVSAEADIRVWVAGCATGEEAYSLAILFHEALEARERPPHLKIFATDVHDPSLKRAGDGIFSADQISEVSDLRLRKYFLSKNEGYQVRPDIRKTIVFARHNLLRDAPFTNLDLVTCRNLLIYLRRQAQRKALSLFHFAMKADAALVLGSSETPGELGDEFEAWDSACKIFRKRRDVRLPIDLRLPLSPAAAGLRSFERKQTISARVNATRETSQVYDQLLDKFMPLSLLVGDDFRLIECFGGAERLLKFSGRRPSQNVLELLDAEARAPIAGALNRVMRHGQSVQFDGIQIKSDGQQQTFRLSIERLDPEKSPRRHYLIAFEPSRKPVTSVELSPAEVTRAEMSRSQMHDLEDELRYTKENLQATIEELETSNEELQAANQELVASNEELQSTNEELHSVNEELYTVNAEYQRKIDELAEINQDVEHLLQSTDVAIVYLDRELCIRKFTPQVARIFDLMPADLGRRISTFTHRIKYDHLKQDLERVLKQGKPVEFDVRDVEERCYFLRMLPYRIGNEIEGVVLSLTDITVLDAARGKITELSAIVESSEDAIIGVDTDGTITSWNNGAERLYGFTPDEAIGRNVSLIVPEGQEDDTETWLSELRKGDHVDVVEVNRRTRDGRGVHVSLALSPIRDAGGKVIGASSISRDISERKLADEASAYLSAIVASSDDAIIGKNLDGIVTSWNAGAERLYGYSAEEMIGQPITKLLPEDRPDEVDEILRRLRQGERLDHLKTFRVRKDGTVLDISLTVSPIHDGHGKLIGASAIARDISQVEQARREHEASENRIRLLLESTAEAIYGLDNEGRCTFVNAACYRLLGFDSPDELLGKNMHEITHHTYPDGSPFPIDKCPIFQAFQRGEQIHCEEELFYRKDGSSFFVEAWSHPMIDDNGEIQGSVVTFLDITERKEAVEHLRNEARRREQFLAMLSHELRNPLSAIRTATRILNTPGIDTETDAYSRSVVDRQTLQMTRLLDDLLDVSRITQDKIALNMAVIDLREAARDAIQSVESLAEELEIAIQKDIPRKPLLVRGDVTRLGQIQANLLTNAIKYSPPGETVRIELTSSGEQAVIRIIDHGAGIAPEIQDDIFDLFVQGDVTLDRAKGGMGVGLTLVRKLVDLHQGTLSVYSEGVGKGSEFKVCLPLSIPDASNRQSEQNDEVIRSRPGRVVVIEDQEDNRKILSTLLSLEGFQVYEAADGVAGLEVVEQIQPEVAIVDIGLPELNGYMVARRLRETLGTAIKLIALTGYGQSQDVERALGAGFDYHLVKPLQPERLLQALNDLRLNSVSS